MATRKLVFVALVFLTLGQGSLGKDDDDLFSFTLEDIQGNSVAMDTFRGKTLLLVNVASQCGQTDTHYKALKRLHDILSHSGRFSVLAFPCNEFGEQEPWEEKEIEEFVRGHFHADFPLFRKTNILAGDKQSPLWKHVIEVSGVSPSWNFEKYLFGGDGKFIQSWDQNTSIEAIFDTVQGAINNEGVKDTQGEQQQADVKEEL